MNHKHKHKFFLSQGYLLGLWLGLSLSCLYSDEAGADSDIPPGIILPKIIPSSSFVVDPFPRLSNSLVFPYDSIPKYSGTLKYFFGIKKIDIKLSRDWQTITITESINGENLKIPFTASVDWYLEMMQQQKWHVKFAQFMQ